MDAVGTLLNRLLGADAASRGSLLALPEYERCLGIFFLYLSKYSLNATLVIRCHHKILSIYLDNNLGPEFQNDGQFLLIHDISSLDSS
jgi:hypothetical protein